MKVLLYDIEVAPNLGYIWGKYEQNVIEYKEEWYILSFAYKWLDQKITHVIGLDDLQGYVPGSTDDFDIVEKLHDLFDEADIVIAHNGDSFDQKKVHARFVYHNMTPPSDYKQIDTKKVAKRYFNFNSNKLDDLGEHLKIGRKVKHDGFETWKGCMSGDPQAWKMMKKYNKQDVDLLERVYLRMRPWIKNHPHAGLYDDRPDACPNCSADALTRRGFGHTKTGKYQRYQCTECGAWSRGRKTENFKQLMVTN